MKLCECGCGQPAPISDRTVSSRGIVRGQPRRFINHHNRRGQRQPESYTEWMRTRTGKANNSWKGDEAGYSAIHNWVRKKKPYTGKCEWCGAERQTQMANLSGLYRRRVGDFAELCISCHKRYDLKRLAS